MRQETQHEALADKFLLKKIEIKTRTLNLLLNRVVCRGITKYNALY